MRHGRCTRRSSANTTRRVHRRPAPSHSPPPSRPSSSWCPKAGRPVHRLREATSDRKRHWFALSRLRWWGWRAEGPALEGVGRPQHGRVLTHSPDEHHPDRQSLRHCARHVHRRVTRHVEWAGIDDHLECAGHVDFERIGWLRDPGCLERRSTTHRRYAGGIRHAPQLYV